MNPLRKHRLLLLCVLVLALIAALIIFFKRDQTPTATVIETENTIAPMEFLQSDLVTIEPQDLRDILPISGELRALIQAPVKALVSGEVTEVLVREGEAVKTGQVLIRMDSREYQARLAQAQGSLVAAQGQLAIAQQTRDNNRALLEKGFISKNAFDTGASQYQIAKANVDSAIGVRDVAQKALNDTIIRAPISGLISQRSVEPGEKVSIDNKLLEIVDLSEMELASAVPTADILNVKLGQEVSLKVEGLSTPIEGVVSRINPATQTGSRSIMTYIRVANPQGLLRSGMFAEGALTLAKNNQVLAIPLSALREENETDIVYAIENDHVVRRQVRTGLRGLSDDGRSQSVEILEGLSPGMRIVKNNLGILKEGTPVRFSTVVTAPSAAPKSK
jgi:membrane fusion protein (multidrug efflux system)